MMATLINDFEPNLFAASGTNRKSVQKTRRKSAIHQLHSDMDGRREILRKYRPQFYQWHCARVRCNAITGSLPMLPNIARRLNLLNASRKTKMPCFFQFG